MKLSRRQIYNLLRDALFEFIKENDYLFEIMEYYPELTLLVNCNETRQDIWFVDYKPSNTYDSIKINYLEGERFEDFYHKLVAYLKKKNLVKKEKESK